MTNNKDSGGAFAVPAPRYRVIADRDKGDDPTITDIEPDDLVTYIGGRGTVIRIERLVPTTDEPLKPNDATHTEFERQEQELFRHQPVMSREGGGIIGCQCLDRFFYRKTEDWGTHLALVMRGLAHPSLPTREQIAEALYRHDQHEDWLWAEEKNEATRESYLSSADAVLALLQSGGDRG